MMRRRRICAAREKPSSHEAAPQGAMSSPVRWLPFHLDKISYWARTVLVPLMVLQAKKPRPANPRGVEIAELFVAPPETVRDWPTGAHQTWASTTFFGAIDRLLKLTEPFFPSSTRRRAIDADRK